MDEPSGLVRLTVASSPAMSDPSGVSIRAGEEDSEAWVVDSEVSVVGWAAGLVEVSAASGKDDSVEAQQISSRLPTASSSTT